MGDPRGGDVSVYPRDVALRIEEALQCSRRKVSLAGLGGFYENATVELTGTSTGRPLQRTRTGGKRDVRRVQVPAGVQTLSIHIIKERGWQVADVCRPGVTEERRVPLTGFELLPDRDGATASAVTEASNAAKARRLA